MENHSDVSKNFSSTSRLCFYYFFYKRLESFGSIIFYRIQNIRFLLVGIALFCLTMGIWMLAYSLLYFEIIKHYDEQTKEIKFELKKPLSPPIFVYFRLQNFYSNYRTFGLSKPYEIFGVGYSCNGYNTALSARRIRPEELTLKSLYKQAKIFPCGIQAISVFNDEYTLVLNEVNDDKHVENVKFNEDEKKNSTYNVESTQKKRRDLTTFTDFKTFFHKNLFPSSAVFSTPSSHHGRFSLFLNNSLNHFKKTPHLNESSFNQNFLKNTYFPLNISSSPYSFNEKQSSLGFYNSDSLTLANLLPKAFSSVAHSYSLNSFPYLKLLHLEKTFMHSKSGKLQKKSFNKKKNSLKKRKKEQNENFFLQKITKQNSIIQYETINNEDEKEEKKVDGINLRKFLKPNNFSIIDGSANHIKDNDTAYINEKKKKNSRRNKNYFHGTINNGNYFPNDYNYGSFINASSSASNVSTFKNITLVKDESLLKDDYPILKLLKEVRHSVLKNKMSGKAKVFFWGNFGKNIEMDKKFIDAWKVNAASTFRKIYARIDEELPTGVYTLNITKNYFPATKWKAKKSIVIAKPNFFGGTQYIASALYIFLGLVFLMFAIVLP